MKSRLFLLAYAPYAAYAFILAILLILAGLCALEWVADHLTY